MTSDFRSKAVSSVGLFFVAALVSVGVFRACSHSANDFSVFYGAWRWVLEGHGSDIYHVSADRFLYAPGFAWLLCPLGIPSREVSLVIWCLLKVAVVAFLIKKLSLTGERTGGRFVSMGLASWGIIMLARPLLIDFEYGQVNLFIVGACVWALLGHFEKESAAVWDSLRWCLLTFAALAKLFPIPLLVVPWIITHGIHSKKLRYERRAVVFGVFLTLSVPLLSQGLDGTLSLLMQWREAILARGLPLESHNQSFTALLHHYLSGSPTPVHSEGGGPFLFGQGILSLDQIGMLSVAWTLMTLGITLGWIFAGSNHPPRKWMAVVIGLLIVPSHLIWKPYFVMSIPLAISVVQSSFRQSRNRGSQVMSIAVILSLFVGINLTGFDFVGHLWAAHFEAASVLLIMHLVLLGMVVLDQQ